MNKEEYKLKLHKHKTLKRSILQKDNIRLWNRLELYQEEDNTPKYNSEGSNYIKKEINKAIQVIFKKIDAEIH